MKSCLFYVLAISLSVKAILLAVANNCKWSKLLPYLFHCHYLSLSPLLIPFQPYWPSQCSSNTTDKILPLAFLLVHLSAWKPLPLQASITFKSWLNYHIISESHSNHSVQNCKHFLIPRTSCLSCPGLFFSIVTFHLYPTLTYQL